MKKTLIAFDIDGTLRNNSRDNPDLSVVENEKYPVANEEIRSLLIILSKFKNVKILVWSGGGELYARQIAQALGVHPYVDYYASKVLTPTDPFGVFPNGQTFKPEIAIDDIHACELGTINLIVKQK